jgi:carbon-monoxide dehydrogenase medium subunit
MYPPKFDYQRASSVSEALTMMQANPDAKLLAGGHSLIPTMKLRLADPGAIIDIGRIEALKGIRNGKIGALTTHAEIAANSDLPDALTEAASLIGDPQVRNRGTIGGNIAHADPASDLPTVLVCLGAQIHVAGPNGERSITADEFFTDLFETALGEDEIVTGISVHNREGFTDRGNGTAGSAYAKLFNPASRYAMVGAAVSLVVDADDNTIRNVSVAIGGLTSHAMRAGAVEDALKGVNASDADAIAAAAAAVAGDLGADDVMGDIHASAEYRRAMAPVMVQRAIMKAVERAG